MPRKHSSKQNGAAYIDPEQPIITVEPINSAPYTGEFLDMDDTPFPAKKKKKGGPAMVFLPSRPAEEDTKKILAASKKGIVLTGSAALGKLGLLIGSLDIVESEDEYLFRVSLPGVSTDKSKFSCETEPNGKILVKGVSATGERIVRKNSQVFEMQTQNLCPPGEFSVAFKLPGPVEKETFSGSFFEDGILGGKIKKRAREVL